MKGTTRTWSPKGALDTPYKRAKQEWDDRIGDAVIQARNWRLATFAVLLFIAMPSLIGLLYVGTLPKKVPHIVEVAQDGSVAYRGAIGKSWEGYTPSAASIKYHLQRFIQATRMISSDGAVVKKNWIDAYKLVTSNGANILNAYVQQHDPFVRAQTERVSVEVLSMVPISSESWQVDWKESSWGVHGELLGESYWRGIFRTKFTEPKSDEQLMANPIGLYIDEFHWSRINR
jgi:type IV secretion system protein VirB5